MTQPLVIVSGPRFAGLFFLLLITVVGFTQSAHPSFFHYTTEDGLPSSECYEIIQDQKGYIWISTDNGVSRFDGYEFKNYGTEEGLLDKTVLVMKEDHRGWIWMSTFSGNFYIMRGDTIVPYEYNDLLLVNRHKYYLTRDFLLDSLGTLHASLANLGLMNIDTNGHHNLLGPDQFSSQGAYINEGRAIYFDELNPNVTTDKFVKIKGYIDQQLIPFDLIRPSREDTTLFFPLKVIGNKNKDFLEGYGRQFLSISQDQFLYQFLDYICLISYEGDSHIIRSNIGNINCLTQLRNGRVLMGINAKKGLLIYEHLEGFLSNQVQASYFLNYTITHITEDAQGGIWLSTLEDGIFYLSAIDVQNINYNYNNEIGRQINQLAVISDSTAIIKYQNNTLTRTNKKGQEVFFPSLPVSSQVPTMSYATEAKMLYVGPYFHYWDDRWKDLNYKRPINSHSSKLRSSPLKKSISGDSTYWTSEYFNRAVILQLIVNEGVPLVTQRFDIGVRPRIRTLEQLTPTIFAIGDMNGLYLYDISEQSIIPHPLLNNIAIRINALATTPAGELVIATHGEGVKVLNKEKTSIETLTLENGLLSNTITHLISDVHGQIWTGSQNGVNKIVRQNDTLQVTSYTTAFGLPTNSVSDLDQWGEQIAVTSSKGVTLLSLVDTHDRGVNTNYNYKVYLHNKLIDLSPHTQLSYRDNTLRFVFYYLDYRYRGDLNYRYRLRAEDDWVSTISRELLLSNLAPADYELEVEVRVPGSPYLVLHRLPFTVAPPFWQLNWVRFLFIAIIAGIAYILIQSYIHNLQREGEKIKMEEKINTLRQQAYRAQMNPHFIFNCLSTIQGMIIGGQDEQDRAIRMVASFSQLIRTALEFSEQETVTLKDELELLHNYLALEKIRFNNNFTYAIEVDATIETDWIEVPPMLVQPFIENAVLHGMEQKTSDGKIIIRYQLQEELLKVTVEDNGPGISHTKAMKAKYSSKYQHKSLGMTITQRRLAILNQNNYEIQVEEPKDAAGQIAGTKVTIFIPLQ